SSRLQSHLASLQPLCPAMAHPPHVRNKSCAHKSEIRAGEIPRSPPARRSRFLPRPFALLDQFPKLAPLLQLLILARRQFGAEKKIAQRVLVQNPMHRDAFRRLFEINPVIFGAITIKFFPLALEQTKSAGIEMVEFLRQNLKFREQIEL